MVVKAVAVDRRHNMLPRQVRTQAQTDGRLKPTGGQIVPSPRTAHGAVVQWRLAGVRWCRATGVAQRVRHRVRERPRLHSRITATLA